jgi:DNA invertase Pin-like site-specific DNA recombinase
VTPSPAYRNPRTWPLGVGLGRLATTLLAPTSLSTQIPYLRRWVYRNSPFQKLGGRATLLLPNSCSTFAGGDGMKVAGYVRVSTDRQAEHGLGLEVQEQAIRRWAKKSGHRLVAVFRDEGVSGSNGVTQRIGLIDALAALKARDAAGLVVARLDRLARDLIIQEQLLAEVKRSGATPFSTAPGEAAYLTDDPDDPSRKLIRQVLGAVSEYERAMISLRLRTGRARKAEHGGFAYGSPPFGYTANDGALVPDPTEQHVIARMRELDAEGWTQREIATTLNREGHRTKQNRAWTRVTVGVVLRRQGAA